MKPSLCAMLVTLLLLPLSPVVFANKIIDTKAEAASITAVDGASINILSPSDSARLDAGEEYPLAFEVALGKGGDHFHVWVDDKRGPGIHEKTGSYALPKLTPGEHIISIQIVDKGHVGTGPKKSIRVIAGPDADPES
jgi:hypothetical protein